MKPQPRRQRRGRSRTCAVLVTAGMTLAVAALAWLPAASGVEAKAPASAPANDLSLPSAPDSKDAEGANPLSAPTRDEALWQMLADFYPERVRQLKALRENDPRKFAQMERQMRPWLHKLREARAQNPELARLMVEQHRIDADVRNWQDRYSTAPQEQRATLLEEGRHLATVRVDLRLQQDRLRIQLLEERLHGLKMALSEREARKNNIIEREVNMMSSRLPPQGAAGPTP